MIITHKLEMDLQFPGQMQEIYAVQGDVNSRWLELTLRSAGEDWAIPENAVAWMRYCKSDGTKGVYDTLPDGQCAWEAHGNVLRMALAPQMLTAAGVVLAQVVLVADTVEAATFGIRIWVERNPAAQAQESEPYAYMLRWMESQMEQMLQQAKESGAFTGPEGAKGDRGKSAYEYAVEGGFRGSEADFKCDLANMMPKYGGVMTGALNMGGNPLTGLREPEEDSEAASKYYVDSRMIRAQIQLNREEWIEGLTCMASVSVSGVRENDWVMMRPVYSEDPQKNVETKAAFDCIGNVVAGEDGIELHCVGNKPDADLVLDILAVRCRW